MLSSISFLHKKSYIKLPAWFIMVHKIFLFVNAGPGKTTFQAVISCLLRLWQGNNTEV